MHTEMREMAMRGSSYINSERWAEVVKLSSKALRELGVERHAGYCELISLEKAGLVAIEPREGLSPVGTPVATILDVEGRA